MTWSCTRARPILVVSMIIWIHQAARKATVICGSILQISMTGVSTILANDLELHAGKANLGRQHDNLDTPGRQEGDSHMRIHLATPELRELHEEIEIGDPHRLSIRMQTIEHERLIGLHLEHGTKHEKAQLNTAPHDMHNRRKKQPRDMRGRGRRPRRRRRWS